MKEVQYELTIFHGIFFVVLTIGCVYQVSDISYLYFSYKANINVRLERDAIVDIPAFSVCTNVSYTIRTDYLSEKFPGIITKNSSKLIQTEYLHKLSLREQLLMATISPEQLFNTCLLMKPIEFEDRISEDHIDCKNISRIRQYLNSDEKCFTILSQLNGENDNNFHINHDISVGDNAFVLLSLTLNNHYLKSPYVNFHSRWLPFESLFSGQGPFTQIYNDKYSGYSFTYMKTTTALLEAPYETDCFNYSHIGYKSHSHCISQCKAQYFLTRFNHWHSYIPVSEQVEDGLYFGNHSIVQNKTLDRLMSDICAKECGKNDNCFNEYFDIKIVEKWKNSENGTKEDKFFEIMVYLPTGMTVKYKHCPRLLLSEYLCYVASIMNLWFGISILTCSKFIFFIYYYFRRRRGKRQTNSLNKRHYYCFF